MDERITLSLKMAEQIRDDMNHEDYSYVEHFVLIVRDNEVVGVRIHIPSEPE